MLLAKHAASTGAPDQVDGNHAIYHHELRTTLEAIGLDVTPAQDFSSVEGEVRADFVFTLLNRAGFQNSEMLAPLLLARRGVPFLGASPIIRGLADDKHLSKVVAARHGVPTARWISCRLGQPVVEPGFRAERLVVKPNASSASWGVKIVDDWASAREHVERLHALGHDVVVEEYHPILDVAVPVIGGDGPEPWLLPPMAHTPETPGELRSYEEKRALVPTLAGSDPLSVVEDRDVVERLNDYSRRLCAELWPFDYGRFEFRFDPKSGAISFMEVNLSCNLWSRKSISRSAASIGMDHATLVESIVAHSMRRQGVISAALMERAA
ncbi:D-alanine--D-alanine ligase family protein [Chenggangzhangella methanolivorans]|uniref:Phosphoribosylglycinamide synthetase n=2 Tax=Chenggangzhangella methanolivorans TaxID=1437009 RepID=A0A9E6R843_9HYPH|nr:phosphoribosylglycinamide synthetase [Chenggangzhangella methanolivorans]QZN98583.1 phosphoribosylglycinamide synthetase [Chenggangzhangella methanolivorans]